VADAPGLVGWGYGNGRVISFSTLIGEVELTDANYAKLFQNSVNWVTATPVPVPGAFWLFASAMIGFGYRLLGRKQ